VVQLGLTFAALGTGGYSQGLFVLFTSLFFDTLFVLAAGNVIRVYRTRNIHETGGAWSRMRVSSIALGVWAAGVGGLSLNVYYTLSAIFANTNPSGGHLAGASEAVVAVLTLAVSLIVVVSAFRVVLTVCSGEVARRRGFQHERVREVDRPLRRWTALALVACAASVVVGLPGIQPVHSGTLSIPGLTFSHFVFFGARRPSLPVDGLALLLSLALLALGIAAAALMYGPSRRAATAAATRRFEPAVHIVARVFLLERTAHRAGRPVVRAGELITSFDQRVLDSVTESLADAPVVAATELTRFRPQRPSLYLAGGLVVAGILGLLSVLAATGHFWVHTT
jgi:NADH:ubiquinone oxidoreductase subunit 5 (subunit L)/multisubunit Na+/H+ antiporter MnhA subunit